MKTLCSSSNVKHVFPMQLKWIQIHFVVCNRIFDDQHSMIAFTEHRMVHAIIPNTSLPIPLALPYRKTSSLVGFADEFLD